MALIRYSFRGLSVIPGLFVNGYQFLRTITATITITRGAWS